MFTMMQHGFYVEHSVNVV